MDYPNDDDGKALRRVAEHGADMSRPMVIDFHVAVPDENTAQAVAECVAQHGYEAQIFRDGEEGKDDTDGPSSYTVDCSKSMLATHQGVVGAQEELNRLCEPIGGTCDGWGTWGNTDDDP